jgi:nucleotide-binding universal stress UspA family protein
MAPTIRRPHTLLEEAALALAQRLQETLVADDAHAHPRAAYRAGQQADLTIIAPEQRAHSEIVWYPHTSSWALLHAGVPLFFWSAPEQIPIGSASGKSLIVVPLDGHLQAERAVPVACALAEIVGGEVVLIHVAPRGTSPDQEAAARQRAAALRRVREARSYLRAAQARALGQTSVAISTKTLLGEPGTTLVAFGRRPGIGAVVMSTHSDLRYTPYFAGAVATQMLHDASIPMFLIPHSPRVDAPVRSPTP